jgi:hypothetical protein
MKNVLVAVLVIVIAFAGFVATRPTNYHVERSMSFAAPPEAAYAQIADFHRWEAWSPWEKLDPTMKKDFGGAASGTGATYHWVGKGDVGEGSMAIKNATEPSDVDIQLDFVKPFAATCDTKFTIVPDGAGSKVTWSMEGKNNFVSKAMCIFMGGMDKMIGPDFEKGLTAMKGAAETAAPVAADSSATPTKS